MILDDKESINPYSPWLALYAMVTRKTERGTVIVPEEAITREQALRCYTINNAFASFEEHTKGSIEPGKLADMIGAVPVYMAATGWMTLMVFGFVWLESLTAFYVYAVIYGFGYAGVMTGVLTSIRALTPPARRACTKPSSSTACMASKAPGPS